MTGGVTVMPGHVVQAPQVSAGTPVVSGSNMMSMSMVTSTIANSTPYQFPITSHTNTSSIQPTPGYPANAAQAIIYVRKTIFIASRMKLTRGILLMYKYFSFRYSVCKTFPYRQFLGIFIRLLVDYCNQPGIVQFRDSILMSCQTILQFISHLHQAIPNLKDVGVDLGVALVDIVNRTTEEGDEAVVQ